jgi:uncharacterized protein YecE (DUF72 family)
MLNGMDMALAMTFRVRKGMQRVIPSLMASAERRIGTAGWVLPADVRDRFGTGGTHLERYARRFTCVEINSSFYRPHRASTYERWAQSVPDDFRFALKMPKEITHTRRLAGAGDEVERFLQASAALGYKRDVLLVQLPPSLAYDGVIVPKFFAHLRARYAGRIACEPRHTSWFGGMADDVLVTFEVARVVADPSPAGAPFVPGGWTGFAYWRLHGTPRVYYSAYDDAQLAAIAELISSAPAPAWCIFDNTAFGAATANALTMDGLT